MELIRTIEPPRQPADLFRPHGSGCEISLGPDRDQLVVAHVDAELGQVGEVTDPRHQELRGRAGVLLERWTAIEDDHRETELRELDRDR